MEYREIQVKGIVNRVTGEDDWFGLSYNMNLYRGCEHQCIYCDTRSECYQVKEFNHTVLIKTNAISLLQETLSRKKKVGMIGFGSMTDPYTYAEKRYNLTGQALDVAAKYRFPVHIITKSDMVLKDIETIKRINQVKARVSFTITTTNPELSKVLEPGAPSSQRRLQAMQVLANAGIETGVVLMPILPFILDKPENIHKVVEEASVHGAKYIIPAFGMTMRKGQREYYYLKLDQYFPGIRQMYEKKFQDAYYCPAQNHVQLEQTFFELCQALKLETSVAPYPARPKEQQLGLFS